MAITLSPEKAAKLKALQTAIGAIEKQHGKGSIMLMADGRGLPEVRAVSTGSLSLDIATGVGGFPRGRIIEVYGPESSGKTTIALMAIANTQKEGGIAAFIDAEHALDPSYARTLGVNTDDLLISQPDSGEQALEIAETLIRSGAVDMVVVDSVAALVPKAELEGDMGQSLPGLQARLMSQAMRKLTGAIAKSEASLVFINQIRHKIGVMFGNPETTTGGNALKFYASMRIDIRTSDRIKEGTIETGKISKVKIVKNKVAPPFRTANIYLYFGAGISVADEMVDLGEQYGILSKNGSWYSYGDVRVGQGRDAVKNALLADDALFEEIKQKVREAAKISGAPAEEPTQEETEGQNEGDPLFGQALDEATGAAALPAKVFAEKAA